MQEVKAYQRLVDAVTGFANMAWRGTLGAAHVVLMFPDANNTLQPVGTSDNPLITDYPNTDAVRSNRKIDSITATWPSNDTFSIAFTEDQNVRRYRIAVAGGSAGDYVKCCEDAVSALEAAGFLTGPASRLVEATHDWYFTGTGWSEWQELSTDPDVPALARLDFLGSAAGPFTIFVQAEG